MARLWISGAETGDMGETATPGTGTAIQTTNVRSGARAFQCTSTGAFFDFPTYTRGTMIYSGYFKITALPGADNTFMQILSGATAVATLIMTSYGLIKVMRGATAGTLLGTSQVAVLINKWYLIELKVIGGTASNGTIEMKLWDDDLYGADSLLEVMTFSSQTLASTTVSGCGFGFRTTAQTIYWDDIVTDDANYPGPHKVIARQPKTGTPTYNTWTPSGSDPYWADTPWDSTNYMTSVTGTNQRQTKLVGAFDTAQSGKGTDHIDAGDTVNAMAVIGVASKSTTATTNTYGFVRRYNGSDTSSADMTLNTTDGYFPDATNYIADAILGSPTLSNMNAMEIGGIHKTGAGTNLMRIRDMWVMVDYTPRALTKPAGKLYSKFGSFYKNPSGTHQSITGLGFQPKAIIFFGVNRTTDGSTTDMDGFIGVAEGNAGHSGSVAVYYYQNNVTTTVGSAGHSSARVEMRSIYTGGLLNETVHVSMDPDGFTWNWTTNDGTSRVICFLAIGGDDVTGYLNGSTHVGTVTGTQNITGLTFRPDLIIQFASSSRNADNSVGTTHIWSGFGATSKPGIDRAYMAHFFEHGVAASAARGRSLMKTNRSFGQITDVQRLEGDLSSFNSDGYSVRWYTHDAYDAYQQLLLLGGGRYKVGSFLQPTSTGQQTIPDLGFRPTSVLLFSANQSDEAINTGVKFSMGAGSSAADRGCIWMGGSDITSPSVAESHLDRTKIIKLMTAGGSGGTANPSTQAAADLVSLQGGSFTLNWTTVDSTQRKISYIAFGYDDPLIDSISGSGAGFAGTPDNSDPFTSGQSVDYTVQPATEVADSQQTGSSAAFGFGEWSTGGAVRYRGELFPISTNGFISKIGFSRNKGSYGVKVYFDTVNSNGYPDHAPGYEPCSFTITNANVVSGYGEYTLPTPFPVTAGRNYCFYLAPWDTAGDVYHDDYQDCNGISSAASGTAELTNVAGSWSQENLTFKYTVYVQTANLTLAPGTYYWRVKGTDPSGSNTYGNYSGVSAFTIDAITPPTVVLNTPNDNSSTANTIPGLTFTGTDSQSGDIRYNLQLWSSTPGWYSPDWPYRVKVTVLNSKVEADITGYPVYVNLNNLPSGFHTNVNQTDARDIRVTKADGRTEVPREVVYYDAASDTGELHFKGDVLNASDVDFYIYYGNNSASDYAVSDTYGAGNVWDAQHRAVYHLNQDPGASTMTSSTAVNKPLQPVTMASSQLVAAKVGKGIDCIPNDYLYANDDDQFDIAGSYSLSAWVCLDSAPGTGTPIIIKVGESGAYHNYYMDIDNTRRAFTGHFNGGGWYESPHTTNTQLTADGNTWYLVSGVYDSGAGTITTYINGVQDGQITGITGTPTTSAQQLQVFSQASVSYFLDGKCDEIRISSGVRTETYYKTQYNNHNDPSTFFNIGAQESLPFLLNMVTGTNVGFTGSPDNTDPYASGQAVTYTPPKLRATLLTSGTDNDNGTSATTASITPSANKPVYLYVKSRTAITATPNIPSVTGNGITWTEITHLDPDNTGSSRERVTVFRGSNASPSAGTISLDFSAQAQSHIAWFVLEISGADTGSDSGAVVQYKTAILDSNATPTSSISATFDSAFGSANNATIAFLGSYNSTTVYTEDSDVQRIIQQQDAAGMNAAGFTDGNNTTVQYGFNVSDISCALILAELKAGDYGLSQGTYYWRVRGMNPSVGTYGDFSSTYSFTLAAVIPRYAFINFQNPGVF